MNKKWIIFAGLILLVIFAITHKSKKSNANKIVKNQAEEIIIPVTVSTVQPKSFTYKITTAGTAKAKEDYTISAKISGEVTFLNNNIGAKVRFGSVIAAIDADMVSANFSQAEANYNTALKNYQRQKNLLSNSLISRQQYELAEAQYKSAQAGYDVAKINLKNAKVTSPIDGTIAEIFVNLHDFANPGKPIFRVINESRIEIKIGISEENIAKVQKGNRVFVKFSALNNTVYAGTITQLGSQADETKTFPAVIELSNYSGLIKGGMIADITIDLNTNNNAIIVPFSLLQKSVEGYYVFIEKDGIAVKKELKVAEILENDARIESGLEIGDKLIIEGFKFVVDGSKIKVVSNK